MSFESRELNKLSVELLFQMIDADNSGTITIEEFKEFLNDRK